MHNLNLFTIFVGEYKTLCNELAGFSEDLVKKPHIVLCNKIDIDGAFDRAKTISLKPQDAISAMRSEEKVDIILVGHILVDQQFVEREMHEISVPSLVATTPRIRSNAIPHNVGYILLNKIVGIIK